MNFVLSKFLVFTCIAFVQAKTLQTERRQLQVPVFNHCPNGSVRHDNSCYFFSHSLANWPDALVYCQAYAAHLLFIEDAREQQFIEEQAKNMLGAQTDPAHYYWIGGTDAVSEGEWYWAMVVRPIEYTNWKANEPNNDPGHTSHHQDCMAMYSSSGLWDDGWCETQHNFICEMELDTESTNIIG